jgi:hypothetical protein
VTPGHPTQAGAAEAKPEARDRPRCDTVGGMATVEDARRIALALPGTSEKISWGTPHWRVRDKGFAWERPLRKTDLAALGDDATTGEILGVRVADLEEKEALVAAEPEVFFTIPHLDGYPAVLVRLGAIGVDELTEVITDAWLDRAPKALRETFLKEREDLA